LVYVVGFASLSIEFKDLGAVDHIEMFTIIHLTNRNINLAIFDLKQPFVLSYVYIFELNNTGAKK